MVLSLLFRFFLEDNLSNKLGSRNFKMLYTPTLEGAIPGGSIGKEFALNTGSPGSIPGSGRSPGEGNGNPFQYSYPENPVDRGAWWVTL